MMGMASVKSLNLFMVLRRYVSWRYPGNKKPSPERIAVLVGSTQVSEKHDEERRQSGKSDNLKQLERLRQEVNDGNGISLTDKATLKQALAELGTNLGVDHKNQSPFSAQGCEG